MDILKCSEVRFDICYQIIFIGIFSRLSSKKVTLNLELYCMLLTEIKNCKLTNANLDLNEEALGSSTNLGT